MAANEDRINNYVDREGVAGDTKFILDNLNEVYASFKKLGELRVGLNGADSLGKIIPISKEVASQTENIAKKTKELTLEQAKQQEQLKANNKAIRDQAKEALGLNDAYKKLVIQFAAQAKEAKNLAVQYGVNSKQAQAAAKEANALNDKLKAIDRSVGDNRRSVGDYGIAVDKAKEKIKDFGKDILGLIGIFSVASFLKDSIDEFLELDKTLRILQNTLKNVGAPELFGRIEENTKDLTRQFKFLKEEDVASVFNKLIVYGKLTEKQMDELLPVIVNFSVATGRDLAESASTIIKAMEGNGKALKEFGINMKDAKSPAEGFSLVMKELAPRVKGVADAFSESDAGKIAATREEFRKTKDEVGEGLLPVLVKLLEFTKNALNGLKAFTGAIRSSINGEVSFAASFLISTLKDNEEVQKEIETSKKLYISNYETNLALLKKLQAEGKKKDVTEKDLIDEQVESLAKLKKVQEDLLKQNAKKSRPTFDSLAAPFEQIQAIDSAIAELQGKLSKGVIGIGDPNKPFAAGAGNKHDAEADFFKSEEEKRKFAFETQQRLIQDEIDAANQIIGNDKKTFAERIKAAQDFYDFSSLLIQKQKEFDLEDVDNKEKEEKRKAEKEITNKAELAKVLTSIDEKYAANRKLIETNYNAAVTKVIIEDEKKRKDLIENNQKEALEHQSAVHELELQSIKQGYDQALAELDKSYNERRKRDKDNKKKLKKDEEEYNKEKLRLQVRAQAELLREDIRFAKAEIAIAEAVANASGKQADIDKVAAAKQKLAALETSLDTLIADFHLKSNQQQSQSDDDLHNKRIEQLNKIKDFAQQTLDIIGGLVQANADKEKNAIQEQIDALEAKRQKDIEVANQSIANAQDQAAAIAVINARADAQKTQLELRQRQAEERNAKFQKAANIANIILSTALAVAKALPNVPLAVAAGAIGAAQLAVAIATPIPKYAHGTEDHPGGLAIMGDAGKKEPYITPSGEIGISDNKPGVYDLPAHSMVFSDMDKMLNYLIANSMSKSAKIVIAAPDNNMSELNKEIKSMKSAVVKAIKEKRELHMNVTEQGIAAMWKAGANHNSYINEQTNW